MITDDYISYLKNIRRYSTRTVDIYQDVLKDFVRSFSEGERSELSDAEVVELLVPQIIRRYEVSLLDDRSLSPRTVNLHLSVLSGFSRYLIRNGLLKTNPVRLVAKPKAEKRLPSFFRREAMERYFERTDIYSSPEYLDVLDCCSDPAEKKKLYEKRLFRLIISILYSLGIRRAELISLNVSNIDFGRKVAKVRGKGDKMREIPLIDVICEEILLYLRAVEAIEGRERSLKEPLLVTYSGKRLYPAFVDRAVKKELSDGEGTTGRKSPHVLRHTLATELLDEGTDLNSIKELLGHSSLAATQIYTHNSVAKLKSIYESAHPRAKNGGKNGD